MLVKIFISIHVTQGRVDKARCIEYQQFRKPAIDLIHGARSAIIQFARWNLARFDNLGHNDGA